MSLISSTDNILKEPSLNSTTPRKNRSTTSGDRIHSIAKFSSLKEESQFCVYKYKYYMSHG